MAFGTAGTAIEVTSHQEGRTTPSSSEHQSGEREYKYSTEEERHSPCEESAVPPRSPPTQWQMKTLAYFLHDVTWLAMILK